MTNESVKSQRGEFGLSMESQKRLDLFKKNIFLVVANEERILNDERLGFTSVPTHLGNCYCGFTNHFELKYFLRLWRTSPKAVLFDDDGKMKFVYACNGGLSGGDCAFANEDGLDPIGNIKSTCPSYYFIHGVYSNVFGTVKKIIETTRNEHSSVNPYSLEEAIEILKRETDKENYAKNIEKFKQEKLSALSKT